MSSKMLQLFTERISTGLDHSSVKNSAEWAIKYRTLKGNSWNFERHPWLYEPHACTDPEIYCMKGAQIGFTEWLLNETFRLIDILAESVLYALPTEDNARDFSAGRFDPALEESKYLRSLFSEAKNVSFKRAGSACLYVRGVKSRAGVKSIPTAGIMMDEIDEWEEKVVKLVRERASGQTKKYIRGISTPSVAKRGIAKLFHQTTAERFFFKCPCCGKYEQLTFDPDDEESSSLVIPTDDPLSPKVQDSYYRCKKTNLILPHKDKKSWLNLENTLYVPEYEGRTMRGFHCNQLYSHSLTPAEIASNYLLSRANPGELQEFYNNKLGETFASEGASVTDADIEACMSSYKMSPAKNNNHLTTMGVDVGGTWLHVVIDQWFFDPRAVDQQQGSSVRTLKIIKVREFEDLDPLIREYGVNQIVIDAEPEGRKARATCAKYYGMANVCHVNPSHVMRRPINATEGEVSISASRTYWLDQVLSRFKASHKTRKLPTDTPQEFKDQVKALIRLYTRNKASNSIVAKYDSTDEDHYTFACFFSEVAMMMSLGVPTSQDITEDYY